MDTTCESAESAPEISRFLLVGSERSGSTMLRLMLDHHPQLSCLFESDFMVNRFEDFGRGSPSQYFRWLETDWHFRHSGLQVPQQARTYREVIDAFFRQRSQSNGKTRVGATIQHGFHLLPKLFPDAKYVHLLRDGRPVAASIVNMGWAGNAYTGARRWRDTIEQVYALQGRIAPQLWLEIRYEELVSDASRVLSEVCAFLGVSYNEQMLQYSGHSTYAVPDPSNAQRWRRALLPREIYLAEMAAGPVLVQAGYEPMFPAVGVGRTEHLALRIHHRVRRAWFRCQRFGTCLLLARWLYRRLGMRREALERRYDAIREAHIK